MEKEQTTPASAVNVERVVRLRLTSRQARTLLLEMENLIANADSAERVREAKQIRKRLLSAMTAAT